MGANTALHEVLAEGFPLSPWPSRCLGCQTCLCALVSDCLESTFVRLLEALRAEQINLIKVHAIRNWGDGQASVKLTERETCGAVGCSCVVTEVAAKNLKDVTEIDSKCKKMNK